MAIPKKKSRPIEVDGQRYRWRVRHRPTRAQRAGRSPLLLAVEAERARGQVMLAPLPCEHPASGLRSQALTPGGVAQLVRAALEEGWTPDAPGKPYSLSPARAWSALSALPMQPIYALGHAPLSPAALDALEAAPHRDLLTLRGREADINGVPLLQHVAEAERPWAAAEHAEYLAKVARGELDPAETIGGRARAEGDGSELAADYWPELVSPGGLAKGADATWMGFGHRPGEPWVEKTVVLGCNCGIVECWPLLVKVDLHGSVVVWSRFETFYRSWRLDLGPFVFDRATYTRTLTGRSP